MPADVSQDRVRRVLAGLLGPLASTLLRCGVSYTEFAEIAKRAWVERASRDYGVRHRPTNIARVAVMTGLSRKEVSRLRRESRKKGGRAPPASSLAAAVLRAWHTDPRYRERSGQPRVLPYSGDGASFTGLVRSVTRDIPPGALRAELVRSGVVRRVDAGHIVPTRTEYVPDGADDALLCGLELGLVRLAETLEYNSEREREAPVKYQRVVESAVPGQDVPTLRAALQSSIAGAAQACEKTLASHGAAGRRRRSARTVRAGVGLYYFDDSVD